MRRCQVECEQKSSLQKVLMKELNLVLTGVRASDSGRYFCRVTSEVGSVQSREAGLRVEDRQQAPEISHR